MPAYYNHPRQMPLTPPEYYEPYAYAGKSQLQPMQPSYDQYQYSNSMYMQDPYYQPSQAERNAQYEDFMARQMRVACPATRENTYGPIAAPVLPPIRSSDQQPQQQQQQQYNSSHNHKCEQPVQEAKQEKSAGGVAAQLDYEMETMIDFVAQVTSGMWAPFTARHDLSAVDLVRSIHPNAISVDKKFRQYVHGVLTSTRLPSATLLLGLHYLSDRIKRRSGRGDFPHRHSNNLYHHLTVALMLASKFLDDNTFQNRSWAEVSQLPVDELNAREMDWLHDIRWHLHVDWEDTDGVRAWFAKWKEYSTPHFSPSQDLSLARLKLNPIDVNMHSLTPSASISPSIRDYQRFDEQNRSVNPIQLPTPAEIQWPQLRSISPPSAGPTNVNTPEYYGSNNVTPSYASAQQSYAASAAFADHQQRAQMNTADGQLLYTKQSPFYGPGYVCEVRQRGNLTYETHHFVGVNYTKQYANQLRVGWCELHRNFDCISCGGTGHHAMYAQMTAA